MDDMIPVVDEQDFDYQAEIARVEGCVERLRVLRDRCVTNANQSTVDEAIGLLLSYADDLQAEGERNA